MARSRRPVERRRRAPLAAERAQTFVALAANSGTSLVAGAVLTSITATLTHVPGLLVLVPAAIGLRGNVYSGMGSRVSTSLHAGTLRLTLRRDSVLGQNVLASLVLTVALSVVAAVVAAAVSVAFGIPGRVSVLDLVAVSVVGGVLGSVIVLLATLALAWGSVARSWDLDALVAPVVSTLGDVVTLPALWLAATLVIHLDAVAAAVGLVLAAGAAGAAVWAWWGPHALLRSIVRESSATLTLALLLSTFAGLALEHRLAVLEDVPVLLVLVPAFISSAGALGGILASRSATYLHLGTVRPTAWPERPVRRAASELLGLSVPVQVLNACAALVVVALLGEGGGAVAPVVATTVVAGLGAVSFVLLVGYGASVAAVRLGIDPDTHGIPLVTSSVDVVGVLLLLAVAAAFGLV